MKKILIFLMLVAVYVGCSLPVKEALRPDPVQLPFLIAPNGGAYLKILVNGKEYKAQFDTGFSGTIALSRGVADELALPSRVIDGQVQRMWGTAQNGLVLREISRLELAPGVIMTNLQAWQNDNLREMVIGLGVLTNYHLIVDYSASNLTLLSRDADSSFFRTDNVLELNFELDKLIWLDCREKDMGEFRLMLDSGVVIKDIKNSYFYHTLSINSPKVRRLLSPEDIFKANRLLTQSPGSVSLSSANTLFMSTHELVAGGTKIGPHVFIAAPLHATYEEGALGIGFFDNRLVLIDFSKERIFIKTKD